MQEDEIVYSIEKVETDTVSYKMPPHAKFGC